MPIRVPGNVQPDVSVGQRLQLPAHTKPCPDVLLKQAVREMEEELARDEQRLKLMKHEQSQFNSHEDELELALKEIEAEMDICFESDMIQSPYFHSRTRLHNFANALRFLQFFHLLDSVHRIFL